MSLEYCPAANLSNPRRLCPCPTQPLRRLALLDVLVQASAVSDYLSSLQDVPAGAVILEVPLSLALTDHPDDAESNTLLEPGSPWAVRLACKLLRERARGLQSPWWPYLQVGGSVVAPLLILGHRTCGKPAVPPHGPGRQCQGKLRPLQSASDT